MAQSDSDPKKTTKDPDPDPPQKSKLDPDLDTKDLRHYSSWMHGEITFLPPLKKIKF